MNALVGKKTEICHTSSTRPIASLCHTHRGYPFVFPERASDEQQRTDREGGFFFIFLSLYRYYFQFFWSLVSDAHYSSDCRDTRRWNPVCDIPVEIILSNHRFPQTIHYPHSRELHCTERAFSTQCAIYVFRSSRGGGGEGLPIPTTTATAASKDKNEYLS